MEIDMKYKIGDIVKVISDGSKYNGGIYTIKGMLDGDYDLGFDDEFFNEDELCSSNKEELNAYIRGVMIMHNNELKNYDKYKSFLIEKACNFLFKNLGKYKYDSIDKPYHRKQFVEDFVQAMEK